jgi:uncharacterized protein
MKANKELEKAVLLGDLPLIKSLIKDGCDIDAKDKYGRTILYDAILKGFQDIVLELLMSKANVNNQDKEGKAPLHFASIHSQVEISKMLVEYGAEIDVKDENGNTPLSDAVFYSHGLEDIILLLQENGADPNLQNNYEVSPKELAESIANYNLSHLFSNT